MSLQLASGQGSSLPEISFAYNAAFTMQVWQKLDGGGSGDHRIGNTNGRFNHFGSTPRWYSQAASTDRLTATTSNSNNTWTHYTLASDGSTLRLYINGVLDNSAAVNASDINYGVDFLLTQGGGTTQKISELRFYNVELSAGNISGNWDARESDSATGLVRRYPLNETSGTVLNDTQSNVTQQNGTLDTGTFDTGDNPSFAAASPVVSAPTSSAIYTSSVTLGASTDQATGQAWVVFDTAANMSGITEAQIKAGQNANSVASVGSGTVADVSIAGSPISITISSLSISIGDVYTYSWVQNNANGDSNILTSTFEVPGLAVSSPTDPLIPGSSASIDVVLGGLVQGEVRVIDSEGTNVTQTITSWPTATGDGTIDFTVGPVFSNNLIPGSVTLRVENSDDSDFDTISTNLSLESGWQIYTVVSIDNDADDVLDADPDVVAGDRVATETFLRLTSDDSVTAHAVTVDPDGMTYSMPDTVPDGDYYFDFRFYDQSDNTWGSIGRKSINIDTSISLPSSGVAYGTSSASALGLVSLEGVGSISGTTTLSIDSTFTPGSGTTYQGSGTSEGESTSTAIITATESTLTLNSNKLTFKRVNSYN